MKKQKPTKSDKAYVFNIVLNLNNPYADMQNIKGKVSRSVILLGNQSLYNLAESIVDAFGFNFDHSFGFFDNLNRWPDSKIKYELFADMPDAKEESHGSKSVKKTKVQQVFNKVGNKILFLFDYGDNWEFILQLEKIQEPDIKKSYPILLESVGKAPEQYPALGEE
jgi:hypothetical protein